MRKRRDVLLRITDYALRAASQRRERHRDGAVDDFLDRVPEGGGEADGAGGGEVGELRLDLRLVAQEPELRVGGLRGGQGAELEPRGVGAAGGDQLAVGGVEGVPGVGQPVAEGAE